MVVEGGNHPFTRSLFEPMACQREPSQRATKSAVGIPAMSVESVPT